MTNVLTMTTKEPIKKCDRCFYNKAVMTGGIMRKRFNYCSRYCSARENLLHRFLTIIGYIFILYLIKFEILPDFAMVFLNTPFAPFGPFYFGEILSFGIFLWLIFFVYLLINSLVVLRNGNMEWIRLTFEEHLKSNSEKVYVLHESQEF